MRRSIRGDVSLRLALAAAGGALALGVLTLVVFLSHTSVPPARPPANDSPVADTPGGPAGAVEPAPESDTLVFVPPGARTDISPMFVAAAEWPRPANLTPVPAGAPGEVPPSAVRNLRELVETWLATDLQPEKFEASFGKDAADRLFVKLRTPPGSSVTGLASCDMVPGKVTFAFTLEFPNLSGPVDLSVLQARLKPVLAPEVAAELEKPEFAPRPHPSANTPEAFSAIAKLDRSGCGAIHPYLYLFATPKRLLGIFQQIPHEKK